MALTHEDLKMVISLIKRRDEIDVLNENDSKAIIRALYPETPNPTIDELPIEI